nr:hypothetical protein [Actinomyces radicidentis]
MELGDDGADGVVLGVAGAGGPQVLDALVGGAAPVGVEVVGARVGEDEAQGVAAAGLLEDGGVEGASERVDGDDVAGRVEDVGG